MSKPNFFIIGAPKCGTTALSEYLGKHQNVFMCNPKEPHYFATDFPKYREVDSKEGYLHLFDEARPDDLAIGEASVWYLYSKEAIKNIKNFDADAKIIVMLRNPVDLVCSMHSQSLYSMNENEKDFQKAWKMNGERKKGLNKPEMCRDIKVLFYDEIAKLGDQVENLLEIYPSKQVKIIFSEDFFGNTSFIYKEVLKFLGLPDDHRHDFPVVNKNKLHNIGWIGRFTQRPSRRLLDIYFSMKKLMGFKRLGFIKALRRLNKKNKSREPLPMDFKKQIINEYTADITKLSRLTNKNLDHWKRVS